MVVSLMTLTWAGLPGFLLYSMLWGVSVMKVQAYVLDSRFTNLQRQRPSQDVRQMREELRLENAVHQRIRVSR
jgi:hypothetical protein